MTTCFLCFDGDLGNDGRPTVEVNGFIVHQDCYDKESDDDRC